MACSRLMRSRSLSIVLMSVGLGPMARAETSTTDASPSPPLSSDSNLEKAEAARSRARGLPQKDRTRLSPLLDDLAALWERVSAELARAQKLEREADQKEQELIEIAGRTERARLLIEQTEARRARALARLKEIAGTKAP